MTFQEAIKHLDAQQFAPLYLITGDEPYLMDQLRQGFLTKTLDPKAHGFNLNQFRGEETHPEQIISVANTFPILSPRRLILVQNASQLKDDQGLLLNYISHPSETTVLVFIAEKPDMRKKFFSTLKKKSTVMHCPRPRERELPQWIRQEAGRLNLSLSEEAVWFLKEHLGANLLGIRKELEKLALYQADEGKQQAISTEVVQMIVSHGRSHSIFELTQAIGNRNGPEAISLLAAILAEGAHPLFVLTMMTRLWRQMAVAKRLIALGESSQLAKKIPMPPSVFQSFLQQLKKWPDEDIQQALELALSADSQLKGSPLPGKLILEALIFDLCLNPNTNSKRRTYSTPFLSLGHL